MIDNIIGKEINGIKVIAHAYIDSYGREIYACLNVIDGEYVYLTYEEVMSDN